MNEDTINELENLVRRGVPISTACDYVGISTTTFYRWYNKGYDKKSEAKYIDFNNRIRNAADESVPEGWKKATTYVDYKYPHKWVNYKKHKVDTDVIKYLLEAIHDPELREKVRVELDNLLNEEEKS